MEILLYTEVVKLYNRFRLAHYRSLFGRIREKAGSLSATEAYALDVIYLLDEPTIKQFSDFLGISQPNATYKINSLVSKGYIRRVPGEEDKREHRLVMTEKFYSYYTAGGNFIDGAVQALEAELPPDEQAHFAKLLRSLDNAVKING